MTDPKSSPPCNPEELEPQASTLLLNARLSPAERAYWIARAEELRPTLGSLGARAARGEIGDGDDIEAIAREVLASIEE